MSRPTALHQTWLLALSAALSIAHAGEARAQSPSNKAGAEALFDEGRRLMDEGKLGEACPKLAESQRLEPGVGTLLNLALCHEKSGQTATAWATYREAHATALAARRPEQAAAAERRAQALFPRLSRLTIAVSDPVEGLEIKRDGVIVGRPAFGMPLPVDPGNHLVTATAPRKKPWSATITVGNAAEASLPVPALEDAPPEAAPVSPFRPGTPPAAQPGPLVLSGPSALAGGTGPEQASERSRGSTQRVAGLVGAGLGVVGLGLGTAFVFVGKSRYDRSQEHCRESNLCDPQGLSLRDDARSAGTVASVALGLGTVALAGGITLWATAPRGSDTSQSARVQLSPTLGGAVVRGAF